MASETTNLLPQRRSIIENDLTSVNQQRTRCKKIFLVPLLLAGMVLGAMTTTTTTTTTALVSSSSSSSSSSTDTAAAAAAAAQSPSSNFVDDATSIAVSPPVNGNLEDATLDMWDGWKSEASGAKSWAGKAAETDKEEAQKLSQEAETWWSTASEKERAEFLNATAKDAHRFGNQVKVWWKNGESAVSSESLSLEEKGQVLEHGFQNWWAHATEEEKSWWNSTVHKLQEDEKRSGKWLHSEEKKLGEEEAVAAEKSKQWLSSTKEALGKKEAVAAEKEKQWFSKEEAAAAEKEHAWWNKTKEEEQELWEKTKAEEHELWDKTKAGEHELWDKTKKAVASDEQVVATKFDAWWATTKAVARKDWGEAEDKEASWWNSTEDWFLNHVRAQGSNDEPLALYLNSSRAYSLLMNGYQWYDYSADFFLYESGLDAQINQGYCAVASAAALLNSLRGVVSLPIDPLYDPHPYATQSSVLNGDCVNTHVIYHNDTFDGIFHAPGGLSLDQTKELLACNLPEVGWTVTAHHVDPANVTVQDVRNDLEAALKDPSKRVIINYDRKTLGQSGGGHFSPLGSYSKDEDAFLVMDVAKYKYPPVWIKAGLLYEAMGTTDRCGDWNYPEAQQKLRPDSKDDYEKAMKRLGCTVEYRGYIVVASEALFP